MTQGLKVPPFDRHEIVHLRSNLRMARRTLRDESEPSLQHCQRAKESRMTLEDGAMHEMLVRIHGEMVAYFWAPERHGREARPNCNCDNDDPLLATRHNGRKASEYLGESGGVRVISHSTCA